MSGYLLCNAPAKHYVRPHRGETLTKCPAELGSRTKCGARLTPAPDEWSMCSRCERGVQVAYDHEPGASGCSFCGAESRPRAEEAPTEPVTKKAPLSGAERVSRHRQRKRLAATSH